MADALRARGSAHAFRPSCLRAELERYLDRHGDPDHGLVGHALVGLLHDIDHDACPRCQGPLRTADEEIPAGALVTSCRCIPICVECEAREIKERSIGAAYPVFDWYHDREVRADVERDLAELDGDQRAFIADLTNLGDREHPVG